MLKSILGKNHAEFASAGQQVRGVWGLALEVYAREVEAGKDLGALNESMTVG